MNLAGGDRIGRLGFQHGPRNEPGSIPGVTEAAENDVALAEAISLARSNSGEI